MRRQVRAGPPGPREALTESPASSCSDGGSRRRQTGRSRSATGATRSRSSRRASAPTSRRPATTTSSPASTSSSPPSRRPPGGQRAADRLRREPRPGGQPRPLPPAPSEPGANGLVALLARPLSVTPKLGETGYVFPVSGAGAFVDTFGAYRADVPGNWHHGDDIFAPLGTPVVAVAHGTVFSVGWNRVGGWRLWLQDDRGNEFYYAHLSAYSPLAVDGGIVNAGDVLGFVGDTGDAEGTAFHLHFEIHPVSLLGLGYDGAVDPTAYLDGWSRLRALADASWPRANAAHSPKAGAVLLQSSDVSSASGLDPGSLRRALRQRFSAGAPGLRH